MANIALNPDSTLKKLIPNLFTLGNLASGFFAIDAIFSDDYVLAAWLVGLSLLLDFFDGFVARLLKVSSELGAQLDSLADVISFGVVPGFLMFKVMQASVMGDANLELLPYLAVLVPVFSAYRLGKFNIDTRQTSYFIGVPTPANAIWLFAIGLSAFYTDSEDLQEFLLNPVFLAVLVVTASVLLVAELPLFSLKMNSFGWKDVGGPVLLVAGIGLLVLLFGFPALVFIIPLYLLLSLIFKPGKE